MLYEKYIALFIYKHTLPLHDADDFCESTAEQQSNFKKAYTLGSICPETVVTFQKKTQFLYKAFQTKKLKLVLKRNQKKISPPQPPKK